ncbi:voltage-gated ion channel protein, putative, partial [Bodo saltans]
MSLLELVRFPSPQSDGAECNNSEEQSTSSKDAEDSEYHELFDFTGFQLTRAEIAALDAPTSLFILSGDNILRLRMLQVIRSRIFQSITLGCIILNSLLLGADWPSYINPPAFATFLQVADLFFTAVFTLEIVVKVIALGFILHDGSFMRVGWNVMDLVIVAFSLVQLILG